MSTIISDWDALQSLFTSAEKDDVMIANQALSRAAICCEEKDLLIDQLNIDYPEWHFFMKDCVIKRICSRKDSG